MQSCEPRSSAYLNATHTHLGRRRFCRRCRRYGPRLRARWDEARGCGCGRGGLCDSRTQRRRRPRRRLGRQRPSVRAVGRRRLWRRVGSQVVARRAEWGRHRRSGRRGGGRLSALSLLLVTVRPMLLFYGGHFVSQLDEHLGPKEQIRSVTYARFEPGLIIGQPLMYTSRSWRQPYLHCRRTHEVHIEKAMREG
jgi:hypothetical protein